jgi:glucan phosphoethanolaminetransferase (alkaline phosphatase superfamily)
MGEIIFWTIIRTALLIVILWVSKDVWGEKYFWIIVSLSFYLFVISPVIVFYRKFIEKNKEVLESSLCSSCKHFDESAVLCMKYDKHPTKNFIPCEGSSWEPR